jgi:hypothetical protein
LRAEQHVFKKAHAMRAPSVWFIAAMLAPYLSGFFYVQSDFGFRAGGCL